MCQKKKKVHMQEICKQLNFHSCQLADIVTVCVVSATDNRVNLFYHFYCCSEQSADQIAKNTNS